MAHHTIFQLVPSYDLSWSLVVSYQRSHCDGLDGAVDDLIAHGNVFVILSLASILIQVQAVNVSCLLFNSCANAWLSLGCHAILAKLTVLSWFICNNHVVPS